MKKRKIISLFMAVALIGAIGVGATLAYFTDSEEAANVVTMGHVNIDLEEPEFDKIASDKEIKDVVPGQEIDKDPTIMLQSGSERAYVRVKLDITGYEDMKDQEGNSYSPEDIFTLNISEENWVKSNDGYYYCQKMLSDQEGENEIKFFDRVLVSDKLGNEAADRSFYINVKAEAIQADNFTPKTDEQGRIIAWEYADGNPVTAESYETHQSAEPSGAVAE